MPKYHIESGELDVTITTPHEADGKYLIYKAMDTLKTKDDMLLGVVIELKGGQFRGDNEIHFNTETILKEMGCLEQCANIAS